MGEAKRRGTYAQRVEQSRTRQEEAELLRQIETRRRRRIADERASAEREERAKSGAVTSQTPRLSGWGLSSVMGIAAMLAMTPTHRDPDQLRKKKDW